MKVALVYDRVNKWGGAERVLLALNELFPDAPLYTSVYDSGKAPWAAVFPEVIPSFLQKIPFMRRKHELLGTFTPIAFEQFDFDGFDLVISVTSEAAKGIITKPGVRHICYCLTPTRYLWSGYREYLTNPPSMFRKIPFYSFFAKPILEYLKKWDKIASTRPDVMVAISTAVRERIKKYYNLDSDLIFPPVETKNFESGEVVNKKNYFLFVSRLIPYKRADLAIGAFNRLELPLIVVGEGSELEYLKRIAGKNIKFAGNPDDSKLKEYYKYAKALIFTGEEDFGIVMAEAIAAGTPVIAYKKGGAIDIVKDSVTGVFFSEQKEEALIKAIKKFEKIRFSRVLFKSARKFSKNRFKKEFKKLVNKYKNG